MENYKLGCSKCEAYFYCGGECEVERINKNGLNYKMCEFKKTLIYYAMYLKIYLIRNEFEMFEEIYEFCEEKNKRNRANKELYNYLENNPSLTFTEGKIRFYDSKRTLKL